MHKTTTPTTIVAISKRIPTLTASRLARLHTFEAQTHAYNTHVHKPKHRVFEDVDLLPFPKRLELTLRIPEDEFGILDIGKGEDD